MADLIVTNNPMAAERFRDDFEIDYRPCSYEALLTAVRDRVHGGYILLTHPLYGSVKPKETPYRTILLKKGTRTDPDSVSLIEGALLSCAKFRDKSASYDEATLADCRAVDVSLFDGAAGSSGLLPNAAGMTLSA